MGSDPPFRVVSENSETELRKQRLLAEAEFVCAEFAANFLRVLRGRASHGMFSTIWLSC